MSPNDFGHPLALPLARLTFVVKLNVLTTVGWVITKLNTLVYTLDFVFSAD